MTDQLYIDEMNEILERVKRVANRSNISTEAIEATKVAATEILIKKFHLNPEKAQDQVIAAAGEEL